MAGSRRGRRGGVPRKGRNDRRTQEQKDQSRETRYTGRATDNRNIQSGSSRNQPPRNQPAGRRQEGAENDSGITNSRLQRNGSSRRGPGASQENVQRGNPRRQMSDEAREKTDEFTTWAKGTVKRHAGNHIAGLRDTAEDAMDSTLKVIPGGKGVEAVNDLVKYAYNSTVGKKNKDLSIEKLSEKIDDILEKPGGKLQRSGQADIDKVKEGKSFGEKTAIDVATTLAETGMDMLLARGVGVKGKVGSVLAQKALLYNRAYGGAKTAAEDDGASEEQAKNKGRATGAIEVLTEGMSNIAKPLTKLYGRGAGDDIIDALIEKMASKMSGQLGKNVVHHGGKTAAAMLTEGLEEMVAEGLDPIVANQIYANANGNPHEISPKDMFYSGFVGSIVGGIFGGAGQIVEYSQGQQVKEVFGPDGVKDLAKKVMAAGEDITDIAKATAINDLIDSGQGVVAGQARELYQAAQKQQARDEERYSIASNAAGNIMRKEGLVPIIQQNEAGEPALTERTAQNFQEQREQITEQVNSEMKTLQLPDESIGRIADSIAAINTGIAGVEDVNLFTVANPEARTAYEMVTGETLPKTNTAVKETLFEKIAMNRVNSARAETELYVDQLKGRIQQDVSGEYGSAGQELFGEMMGAVDERNVRQVEDSVVAFEHFYKAGRAGIDYSGVAGLANPAYESVPASVRKAAWEAGKMDLGGAFDTAERMQIEIGKTIAQTKKSAPRRGRVISELSLEGKKKFARSEQALFRHLARAFNINIHVVDSLPGDANGMYSDGEVFISVNADRALEYVFAHEITHHMEIYAPEEYQKLKELVRNKWAEAGGIDEAIEKKRAHYADREKSLSYEQALDEILADSTYEMIQDESFVDELCKTDRGIAQAILDAIKNVLAKIRALIVDGEKFTQSQNADLLSELGILKEAEKLWADGLMKAAENRGAVGATEVSPLVRYSKENDNSSVRDQLRNNMDKLKSMDPVADVTYESIKHLNRSEKAKIIMKDYDKKFKGGIERPGFGFIVLREDEVTGSLKYLHTDGEFAAFKALPQLLKRGKIIEERSKHKNRPVDSVTIAAPVTINGTDGYMAAVVKVGGKNRYHVHRILMPDGSEFEFNEKTEPTGAGMPTENGNQGSAISSAFDNSIPKTGEKGKKFSFKDSDGRELSSGQVEYFKDGKIRNETPTENPDIRFSLKNKNITPDTKIPFVEHAAYMPVAKNDHKGLKALQDKVRGLKRGTYENRATGYKADITSITVKKAIYPTTKFNRFASRYIDNLNAILYLPELFQNAVYVDSKEPQKMKNADTPIRGYHHFVAPIYMDNTVYRALITARDAENADVLYVLRVEVLPITKDGAAYSGNVPTVSRATPSDISISDLIDGVKIYDYDMQQNNIYSDADIKFSLPDPDSTNDYINSHPEEFLEAPPVRDYEKTAARVRTQTMGELLTQVEKLKKDKRLTHGRVLDKNSIREEINALVRVLMSHSEGTSNKTNHKTVEAALENAAQIFKLIKEGDHMGAANTAYYSARDMVQNLDLVDDFAWNHYKELRDTLWGTAVTISEQDKSNIPDFADFRNRNMGRLRIVNNGGVPVDTFYAELCETYPELFGSDVENPADQLMRMAEVRESLEPYDIMMSAEETEQLIKQTAQDLLDVAVHGKPWTSWADRQKNRYDEKVKAMKALQKEAVNDVKIRERMRATQQVNAEKLKYKSYREKVSDGKRRVKAYGSIKKNYDKLCQRAIRPTDKKHLPDGYETAIIDLLMCFDLQTERSKKLQKTTGHEPASVVKYKNLYTALDALKMKYEAMQDSDDGVVFYDVDFPGLVEEIKEKLNKNSVDQLDTIGLESLNRLFRAIVHHVNSVNGELSDKIKASRDEMGERIIQETIEKRHLAKKKGKGTEFLPIIKNFFASETVCPPDHFEIMGGGIYELYMDLRRAFDKHIRNVTEIQEEFERITGKFYNKKLPGGKIDEWETSKSAKTFKTSEGREIELSAAQRMSIYCLSKRPQAVAHMTSSGIKVMGVKPKGKVKATLFKPIMVPGTFKLSDENIKEIIGSLTEEQIEVAEEIQNLMNTRCKDWGNEASLKLNGYKKFLEENYFPIRSSGNYIQKNPDMKNVIETVLNFSFTKSVTPGANNPIEIGNIFDVATEHMTNMSMYNTHAQPVANFKAVTNYRKKGDDGSQITSVRDEFAAMYGDGCNKYNDTFITDISSAQKEEDSAFLKVMNAALSNIKVARVAGNLRVAIQQPVSIHRAFTVISPKWFLKSRKRINIKASIREMQEHCPIAKWKSLGFYDTDMSKSMKDIITNRWRLRDVTLYGYGLADNITWSFIWEACRAKVEAEHSDVKIESDEYWELCNEEMSYVVDRTQVVDSPFHRSQIMRRKNFALKAATTYMSEPIKLANTYRTMAVLGLQSAREGNRGALGKAVGGIALMHLTYSPILALCQSLIDTWRDAYDDYDEDDETFWGNFLENLIGNLNPLNLYPGLREISNYIQGYGISNLAADGIEDVFESLMGIYKHFTGESDESLLKSFWNITENGMEVFGGQPIGNLTREIEGLFHLVGIDVFAAEAGEDEKDSESPGEKIKNGVLGALGIEPKAKVTGPSGREKTDSDYYGIYADSKPSVLDKLWDKSTKEMRKEDREKRIADIKKDIDGLVGYEREEKLWKTVTHNYRNYVADGEFETLKEMRKTLEALGGDVEKFDKKIMSEVKTAFKKNIGIEGDTQKIQQYKEYLMKQGYTDGKISNEIISSSETAKEFQKQVCLNDFDTAVDCLADLLTAGITYEDAYVLFQKRYDAIDAADYSTGEFVFPATGDISSYFGYRESPGGIGSTDHKGIDIAAAYGSDVGAVDGGYVSKVDSNSSRGIYIEITHGNGRKTRYQHLSATDVLKGDIVSKGQLIGAVGSTGNSTGPHLHFEVMDGNTYIDPMVFFR